jgi:cellulose biosynthesis protein BcsQ
VLGGSGGVGASTFAAVLAWAAGRAVLVDLDPVGGGLDVLLGIEDQPGARWSGVRLDGGRLDPQLLADGLPRWAGVPVLAADLSPPTASIEPVLAAASAVGVAVLDLPRGLSPPRDAAAERCDVVLVLAEARVRPLAAARAVLATLPDVPAGVLVRRGDVPVEEAIGLLGSDPVGFVPMVARGVDLTGGRVPHGLARVAAGVVDALTTRTRAVT